MSYKINVSAFNDVVLIPGKVADNLIKLSSEFQLKVLIIALREDLGNIEAKNIAQKLNANESDVTDALSYWAECGVLEQDGKKATEVLQKEEQKQALTIDSKPNREDTIARGLESDEVMYMLREAQMYFGRPLRQNESSTLLWLHDNEKMDVAIILMALAFAVSEQKLNISFVEKTVLDWVKNGVTTIKQAEEQIFIYHTKNSCWSVVEKSLGISHRKPSKKEEEYAVNWVSVYQFNDAVIKAAYDICVDSTSKFSMPYINKILTKWHKGGVKTVEDIAKLNQNQANQNGKNQQTYNLDSYNEKLEELPE